MAILVMCTNPECCELFHVSDQTTGTEIRCPICGTTQRVTAQSKTDASAAMEAIGATAPENRGETPSADDADDGTLPPSPAAAAKAKTAEEFSASLELAEDDDDEDELPDISSTIRVANSPTNPMASVDAQDVSYELSDLDDKPSAKDTAEPDLETISSAVPHIRPSDSSSPLNVPVEFTEMDDPTLETRNTKPAEKDLLDLKPSGAIILSIGLAGMLIGLVLGWFLFPWHPLLNAYLGGGLGWIAGFTAAFLLVGAYQKNPERMRCGLCGCVSSSQAETCGLCGAPLSMEDSSPMLWTCLRAGPFAFRRWLHALRLVFYVVLTYAVFWFLSFLWTQHADTLQPWQPVRYGLNVLFLALLASYCVRYFLAVIEMQYRTPEAMPESPAFFSASGLIRTFQTLLMLAMIVLPLITLPLLPLGLLQQSTTGKYVPSWRALVHTIRREPKDFALLWLFVLIWSAGTLLGALLMILVFDQLVFLLCGPGDGVPSNLLQGGIMAIGAAVAAMAAYCPLVAVCRCIGRFGRFCPLA